MVDKKRRLVVTGFGLVTPLGNDSETSFNNIIASKSGIDKITKFDTARMNSTTIAGEVKDFSHELIGIDKKEAKKMDLFMQYAIKATNEALEMANWEPKTQEEKYATGVCVGSGIGGLDVIEENVITMTKKSPKKLSPFFIPKSLINLASGFISIQKGFMGPNMATVTACATGAHAIDYAAKAILDGDADIMVAGGSESAVCESGIGGFAACRALSTKNDDNPQKASRPWDKDRDGFVMGEGAGIIILEDYEHAKKRGTNIICEYVSCGMAGDAYHITAPHENGLGAKQAMRMALKKAGLDGSEIDYVNAHGTSTPLGDIAELKSVCEVLEKSDFVMSSTKSAIGHLLGAAGAVEAVFSIQALVSGDIPPTLNLDNPDEEIGDVNLVAHKSIKKELKYVMSNSFGFGGTNTSMIFKKFEG